MIDTRQYFDVVPAGVTLMAHAGFGVFIKWLARDHRRGFELLSGNSQHMHIRAPDRELYITTHSADAHPYCPPGFHEYVNLSHFHAHASNDLGPRFVLMNYTAHDKRYATARMRQTTAHTGTQIIVDSGGHQLRRGLLQWVNPEQEIRWYNRNADLGMLLDAPTKDQRFEARSARVQRCVIDLWKQLKRPDLSLVNIMHGATSRMAQFWEVVADSSIDRVAISPDWGVEPIQAIQRAITGMTLTQGARHHHILGVTHRGTLLLLMYLAKRGMSPLITADSSTPIQLAYNRQLNTYWQIEDSFSHKLFNGAGFLPSGRSRIPCNCPVCSTLGWAENFRVLKGEIPTALIALHNIYTMDDWVHYMASFVWANDVPAIKEMMTQQFLKGYGMPGVRALHLALDYADYCAEHGLEQANLKFASPLAVRKTGLLGAPRLWADPDVPADDESQADDHIEYILQKFEEYFELG